MICKTIDVLNRMLFPANSTLLKIAAVAQLVDLSHPKYTVIDSVSRFEAPSYLQYTPIFAGHNNM